MTMIQSPAQNSSTAPTFGMKTKTSNILGASAIGLTTIGGAFGIGAAPVGAQTIQPAIELPASMPTGATLDCVQLTPVTQYSTMIEQSGQADAIRGVLASAPNLIAPHFPGQDVQAIYSSPTIKNYGSEQVKDPEGLFNLITDTSDAFTNLDPSATYVLATAGSEDHCEDPADMVNEDKQKREAVDFIVKDADGHYLADAYLADEGAEKVGLKDNVYFSKPFTGVSQISVDGIHQDLIQPGQPNYQAELDNDYDPGSVPAGYTLVQISEKPAPPPTVPPTVPPTTPPPVVTTQPPTTTSTTTPPDSRDWDPYITIKGKEIGLHPNSKLGLTNNPLLNVKTVGDYQHIGAVVNDGIVLAYSKLGDNKAVYAIEDQDQVMLRDGDQETPLQTGKTTVGDFTVTMDQSNGIYSVSFFNKDGQKVDEWHDVKAGGGAGFSSTDVYQLDGTSGLHGINVNSDDVTSINGKPEFSLAAIEKNTVTDSHARQVLDAYLSRLAGPPQAVETSSTAAVTQQTADTTTTAGTATTAAPKATTTSTTAESVEVAADTGTDGGLSLPGSGAQQAGVGAVGLAGLGAFIRRRRGGSDQA